MILAIALILHLAITLAFERRNVAVKQLLVATYFFALTLTLLILNTSLVIKGYEQTVYGETFAPVARLMSLRMLLAEAAKHGYFAYHMDIVRAFLNP